MGQKTLQRSQAVTRHLASVIKVRFLVQHRIGTCAGNARTYPQLTLYEKSQNDRVLGTVQDLK